MLTLCSTFLDRNQTFSITAINAVFVSVLNQIETIFTRNIQFDWKKLMHFEKNKNLNLVSKNLKYLNLIQKIFIKKTLVVSN